MSALFELVKSKSHREVQPIPEDKPSRFSSRKSRGTEREDGEMPQKGDSWESNGESVTLFMNGGKMLGIRPKDIAGLFYNTVEMDRGAIGDIRMFPKHSLIEVDAAVAPKLLEALSTATICGYEVNVREDKGAPGPEREDRGRSHSRRPFAGGFRGGRGERFGNSRGGSRSGGYASDSERGGYRDRGSRSGGGFRSQRGRW